MFDKIAGALVCGAVAIVIGIAVEKDGKKARVPDAPAADMQPAPVPVIVPVPVPTPTPVPVPTPLIVPVPVPGPLVVPVPLPLPFIPWSPWYPYPRPYPYPHPYPHPHPHGDAEEAPGLPVVGGPVSPDGKCEIVCDLPNELKKKNVGGTDGAGLCVFTAGEYNARYCNERALFELQKYMRTQPGGGYPQKVDAVMKKFAPEVKYGQHTAGDEAVLAAILKTGRGAGVTYNGHDPHYQSTIAHMVWCVHYDRATGWACISDNNYPNDFMWMSCDEFCKRWKGGGGGWIWFLLRCPPPPPPHNWDPNKVLPVSPTPLAPPPLSPVGPKADGTFNKALEVAQASGKKVVLVCSASWCPACKVLDANLRDPAVQALLASKFVAVHVDTDRDPEGIARRYGVSGIPAYFLIDPTNPTAPLKSGKGSLTPAQLVAWLN